MDLANEATVAYDIGDAINLQDAGPDHPVLQRAQKQRVTLNGFALLSQ